jgi:hypothetical protein
MNASSPSAPRLGDLLVELGAIRRADLEAALRGPRPASERLGQTLMRLGLVSRTQLEGALHEQYRRCLAGALGALLTWCLPAPALAGGGSVSLNLVGRVPVRSSVQIADVAGDLVLPRLGAPADLRLARVFRDSNSDSPYAVVIESESARVYGQPMLLGAEGQSGVPYRLIDGGRTVTFVDGRAEMPAAGGGRQAVNELRVSLPSGAAPDGPVLADTLRFVVRAN